MKNLAPNKNHFVFKQEDMEVVTGLFGARFVSGGAPDGLIEVYLEDDENYHLMLTFNQFWLKDFKNFVELCEQHLKLKNEDKNDC